MLGIRRFQGVALDLFQGDITTFTCDAIVNAANSSLLGGGGVDGAIHKRGGPKILAECKTIGHCDTGQAVATTAGELPATTIIHTVGPRWAGGQDGEASLLASAYYNSLMVGHKHKARHISFPAISTGIYGYPAEAAAEVSWLAVKNFLEQHGSATDIERITFVLFSNDHYKIYQSALFKAFPE